MTRASSGERFRNVMVFTSRLLVKHDLHLCDAKIASSGRSVKQFLDHATPAGNVNSKVFSVGWGRMERKSAGEEAEGDGGQVGAAVSANFGARVCEGEGRSLRLPCDASSFRCTSSCPGVPACQVLGANALAKSSFVASVAFPRELTASLYRGPERDLSVPPLRWGCQAHRVCYCMIWGAPIGEKATPTQANRATRNGAVGAQASTQGGPAHGS